MKYECKRWGGRGGHNWMHLDRGERMSQKPSYCVDVINECSLMNFDMCG